MSNRKVRTAVFTTCAATAVLGGALAVTSGGGDPAPDRSQAASKGERAVQQRIGTMSRPAPRTRPAGERWVARWAFRPADVREMTAKTDAAFVGKVTSIEQGPGLGGESVHHKPGEYELPTQVVTLSVEDAWYGIGSGESIELRKVGTEKSYIEGDPRYEVGERYVMFVEKGELGWGLVAPDGRLRIVEDKVRPVIEGSIGRRVKDKPAGELKREAQDAKKEQKS